jgi:hypothetical protein
VASGSSVQDTLPHSTDGQVVLVNQCALDIEIFEALDFSFKKEIA